MRDWGLLLGTKALLLAALVVLSLMLLIPDDDDRLVVEPSAIKWSHDLILTLVSAHVVKCTREIIIIV